MFHRAVYVCDAGMRLERDAPVALCVNVDVMTPFDY